MRNQRLMKRLPISAKHRSRGPEKPMVDPLLSRIVELLNADTRSRHAKAQVSGLASSTLKNWQEHRVRRPQSVSIQMAARALGYKLVIVPDDGDR